MRYFPLYILILVVMACGKDISSPLDESRSLTPATHGCSKFDIFGKIYKGTNLLTTSEASNYSIHLAPVSPHFGGDHRSKIVKIAPPSDNAMVIGADQGSNNNFIYEEGLAGCSTSTSDTVGTIWIGKFRAELSTETGGEPCKTTVFAHNGVSQDTDNGNFLDQAASDLEITFNLTSNGSCSTSSVTSFNSGPPHPVSSTDLTVSISSAPDTVTVGQSFSVAASSSGGFASSTHRYAWDFDASGGNTEDFTGSSFSSSNTKSFAYSAPGIYDIRILARDGTDVIGEGGNYAISTTHTIVVAQDSANAMGALMPHTMSPGEIASVGVVMDNVGTTTWSSDGTYSLDLHRDGVWTPFSVPLTTSVSPGTSHSFMFNLVAPEYEGEYACFYRMKHGGFFGQENGQTITVTSWGFSTFSSEELSPVRDALAVDPKAAWLEPNSIGREYPLNLDRKMLSSKGFAAIRYSYHYAAGQDLNVILQFNFDPDQVEPAGVIPKASVPRSAGLVKEGEFWARFQGRIPKGHGEIALFPFLSLQDSVSDGPIGTVTIYETQR